MPTVLLICNYIIIVALAVCSLVLLRKLGKAHDRIDALESALQDTSDTLDIWLDAEPAELIYAAYHRIQMEFMYNSQIKQARRAAAKIMGIRLPCDKERKCST